MSGMRWAGYWQDATTFNEGDVVIYNGTTYLALKDTTKIPSRDNRRVSFQPPDWIFVGPHEPHKIDHPWNPEEAQYPLASGLSEVTLLCRECWFTRNFIMSFKAEAHNYVIQEMP